MQRCHTADALEQGVPFVLVSVLDACRFGGGDKFFGEVGAVESNLEVVSGCQATAS